MNTASAIRSAVAGRSERLQHRLYSATGLGEVFNDSNVHLSVKSSPEKTALALSPLAEKEGTVVKLNDSGGLRLIIVRSPGVEWDCSLFPLHTFW